MMYVFEVIAINPMDQDDITIKVDNVVLRCWAGNSPAIMIVGGKYRGNINIEQPDKLILEESKVKVKKATQLYSRRFDYHLRGVFDVEKGTLDVGILLDFYSRAQLYDYGFLHDKYVECVVPMIQLFVQNSDYTHFPTPE